MEEIEHIGCAGDVKPELQCQLIVQLGTEDFEHVVDEVEWTDPKYYHQN